MALILSLSLALVSTAVPGFGIVAVAEGEGGGEGEGGENISYRPDRSVDLTSREDFGFGINVHESTYAAYPEAYLEQQIHAVAKMGSKYIRMGLNIPSDGDWTYYDTAVGLANKYGLKIIAVIKPSTTMGLDLITATCETFARRYNGTEGRGFVDIFQVWNEIDITCMQAKYGNSSTSGESEDHYYTVPVDGAADLPEWLEYYQAAEKGLHCEDSNSKFLLNFAATHHGFVKYLLRNGLKLDYVGWDYYSYGVYDFEKSAKDAVEYLGRLEKDIWDTYQVPVIVCETNSNAHATNQEDRENPTLDIYEPLIDYMYLYYERDWIKGAVFYELIDELAYGQTNPESWFGLLQNDGGGEIKEENEKAIYKEIQRLLKGSNELPVIDRSEVDLEPYKKLIVDTADDSQIGKDDGTTSSEPEIGGDVELPPDDTQSEPEVESQVETESQPESKPAPSVESTPSVESKPEADTEQTQSAETVYVDGPVTLETVYTTNTVYTDPSVVTKVEEVLKENVVTPVKDLKSKQTSYVTPWDIIIIAGAGMLVAAAGAVVVYVLIMKKKLKK